MKKISKVLSVLIVEVLIFTFTFPVMANSIPEDSVIKKDVEFDAYISSVSVADKQNNDELNIDSKAISNLAEKAYLELSIVAPDEGYLKNIKLTLENSNFKLDAIEDTRIKSMNDSEISFNQINASEKINLEIPVSFNKTELASVEDFNKESEVKFTADFVVNANKENKIEKSAKVFLEWKSEAKEIVSQELVRYLKINNAKTLLTYKITDEIENNAIPYLKKEIKMLIPVISEKLPVKVTVSGDDIEYRVEKENLIITKENKKQEDKYNWNSQDEYIVTCIYDSVTDEKTINSSVNATVTTINNETIVGNSENNENDIKKEIGDLVEVEVTGTKELNKGYIYSNQVKTENKFETPYELNFNLNIGYIDLIDKVLVVDNQKTEEVITKKLVVDKDELIKILGENGFIKVLDNDGNEISRITKDQLEIELNRSGLSFETSKPISEGNIKLKLQKAINKDLSGDKNAIKSLTTLNTNILVQGIYQDTILVNKEASYDISFVEPTSNASIKTNFNTLSTITKNEGLELSAILKTSEIGDALYKNPQLRITLPEEVTNIELVDANLIYEEELRPVEFTLNGREIYLRLEGEQTNYAKQDITNGALVKIIANVELNNLSVSKNENIIMDYSNENNSEVKRIITPVKVVAPSNFITTNTIEINGVSETTQVSESKKIRVAANAEQKQARIFGTVINNLGTNAEGVKILGKVPSKGDGLGSTFTETLASAINVNGINATVYYSEDNSIKTDSLNNWSTDFNANAKWFLIVINEAVANEKRIDFNYVANIPKNIEYENKAVETFNVLYNSLENQNEQNTVVVPTITVETGAVPVLVTSISAKDAQTDELLNDELKKGRNIEYLISVTNTGKENSENTKLSIQNHNKEFDLGTIGAGETKTTLYKCGYDEALYLNKSDGKTIDLRTTVTASNSTEVSSGVKTLKIVDGIVNVSLSSIADGHALRDFNAFDYDLKIKNFSINNADNLKVTVHLPKEMKYVESSKGQYNEQDNTIVYTKDSLYAFTGITDVIRLMVLDSATNSTDIQVYATYTYDGQSELKSNTITSSVGDLSGVKAYLTTNIDENKIYDTDEFEYYLTIDNTSKMDTSVSGSILPSDYLTFKSYAIERDGIISEEKTIDRLTTDFEEEIKAGKKVRLIIKTLPKQINSKNESIETTPDIDLYIEGKNLKIESKPISIKNTLNTYKTQSKYEINNEGRVVEVEKGEKTKYFVQGTAWYDNNKNGKQEENEAKMTNVEFLLYDQDNKKIVTDSNGNEIVSKTDINGNYKFENIDSGNYIVISKYNAKKYSPTSYMQMNTTSNENSNFVGANLNGTEVAASSNFRVDNANEYNVDFGIKDSKVFSLKTTVAVVKATVINEKRETKTYTYDNKKIAKVELDPEKVEGNTVLVEYKISVTNTGNIEGYAKEIVDYLPKNMYFIPEMNDGWYLSNDGNAYNTSLANKIIKPGETKDITIVLSKKMTGENVGLFHNSAEITASYNKYGVEDTFSKPGNKNDEEQDLGYADILIGINTGKTIAKIIGISLLIAALIGLAIVPVKLILDKNQKTDINVEE